MGTGQVYSSTNPVEGHRLPAAASKEADAENQHGPSPEVSMARPLDVRSKWLWFRTFGAVLAVAPGVVCLTLLVASAEEDSFILPFIQYVAVAAVAIVLGYVLMRKGMAEEERERIRVIVREVLAERGNSVSSSPPANLTVIEGGKANVTQLPFMDGQES
jgi:uncharacterized membrane protein